MKAQKIETVAKILIANKVSFNYEGGFLKVTDAIVSYELFDSASYHTQTKELVLMCNDYTHVISFDTLLNYFKKQSK